MTKLDAALDFSYAGVMPEPASVAYLIEQSADIAVNIDGEGIIRGVYANPETPSLGSLDHWVGRLFTGFLTEESKEKFAKRLREIRDNPALQPRSIELNHSDNATWEFPIRYAPLRIAGSNGLLLLGRDLQPLAEVQRNLVNSQLARDRDLQKLRGVETYYRVVLEASATPIVIVDAETARIRDVNPPAADLLGAKPDTLRGNALNQAFENVRRGEFMEALQAASSPEGGPGVAATVRRNGKAIMVCPRSFRAAGEPGLLCRLVPISEDAPENSEITSALGALYAGASEAIVILDAKGAIREANDAFLVLADAAQLSAMRERSFADFLQRGEVDLRLLLDSARRQGQLRNYVTQFRSIVGTRATVGISATLLRLGDGESGIGLIIRDTSLEDRAVEDFSKVGVSEEAVKNVMDLVGTASLKELVSATSDVIERMCIDTALKLTSNNRVAAAEMLGLSRQSLYVKLRKYGMLDSDGSA